MRNIPWAGLIIAVVGLLLRLIMYRFSRYWYVKNPNARPNYWPCGFAGAHAVIAFGVTLAVSKWTHGWWTALTWAVLALVVAWLAWHVAAVVREEQSYGGHHR